MKNIDFLPPRFRERNVKRSAVIERWTMVIGVAAIILPLAIYQYAVHFTAVYQSIYVEPDYLAAQAKSKRLAELQQKLELASAEAGLLAWLNHPWPRSQVLAQLHGPLPKSVRLTSIKLNNELKQTAANPTGGRPRPSRPSEAEEANLENRPAAEKDFAKLQGEATANDYTLSVTGVTVDTTELHSYVAKLRLCGLFSKSELRSLESQAGQSGGKGQTFELRIVLSDGHGTLKPPSATPQPSAEIARRP